MMLLKKIFKKSKTKEVSKSESKNKEKIGKSQSEEKENIEESKKSENNNKSEEKENIEESKKSENINQSEEKENNKSEEISDSGKKEDNKSFEEKENISDSEKEEEDFFVNIESQNIGTHYYLCDFIEKANFIVDNSNIIVEIPKEKKDESNSEKITDLTAEIYDKELIGIIKELDNKNIENKQEIDNNDIIIFLIKWQNYLSLLNYKLNNNKRLNSFEKTIIDILNHENKNTIMITEEKSENNSLKNLGSKKLILPKMFYDDAKKIEKDVIKNDVDDINAQLKLDIFNYLFGKHKKSIKYEKELKKVCNYYINQLYPKTAIVYSITNDNKEVEREAIVTSSKIVLKKKTLVSC